MRILRTAFFCLAFLLGSLSASYAASYKATLLPDDFRLRNNVGAQLRNTDTFNARTTEDWDMYTTVKITDRNGAAISEYRSPNHSRFGVYAFNDAGVAVGSRTDYFLVHNSAGFTQVPTFTYAMLFAEGSVINLNDLLNASFGTPGSRVYNSVARDINNAGEVVGDFSTYDGQFGFIYRNGTVINLGPLGDTVHGRAYAINNFGQVVGVKDRRAFKYSEGTFEDLGILDASKPESIGTDINDAGQAVGAARVVRSGSGDTPHAFLHEGGTMFDLNTPAVINSTAKAINNAGFVVGHHFAFGQSRAFVYRHGIMTDLNLLFDPTPNVGHLYEAVSINDDGVIVASSVGAGPARMVLLTPTPTPGIDNAVFNFEGGMQGWKSNGEPIINVQTAMARPFAGEHSLVMLIRQAGFASVRVRNPSAHAGHTIKFHVYISTDSHIEWVQPYAQEGVAGEWGWHGAWTSIEGLQVGAWNTLEIDVPADAAPLDSIGLEFFASQPGGAVFIDSVDYGSKGDYATYNFENGTHDWQSSDSSASTATSDAQTFSGERSLEISLSNATFASIGVTNPAATAGQTVTFNVYVPAGAPITGMQPFALEGAAGNWSWHGTWTLPDQLQYGAWNTIRVAIPQGAQALHAVGLEIFTSEPYSGTFYLDSVTF